MSSTSKDVIGIEARVIRVVNQFLYVITQTDNRVMTVLDVVRTGCTILDVCHPDIAVSNVDPAHYDITDIPSLSIEHIYGMHVLHAEIEQLRVVDKDNALV